MRHYSLLNRHTNDIHIWKMTRPIVGVVFSFCGAVSHAQFRASIQGTITDPQGAVIPGATITLTDTGTNRILTATSNGSGVYNFNALPPDHFTLTADAAGFKKKVIQDVRIIPEQPNNIDFQLSVGDTGTTITVTGDTIPALETGTASISGTIFSNDVQHMPSANRDVFQLVQLAPGVFGDASQQAGGGSNTLPGTQGPGGSNNNQGIFATENGPQAVANGGSTKTTASASTVSVRSAQYGQAPPSSRLPKTPSTMSRSSRTAMTQRTADSAVHRSR